MNTNETMTDTTTEPSMETAQETAVETAQETAKKRKKVWKENEAPVLRWILMLAFCFLIGQVIAGVLSFVLMVITTYVPAFADGAVLANQKEFFVEIVAFSGMYIGFVVALKLFTRTSVRSFVLGADRIDKVDRKKEVFPIIGLYLLGLLFSMVFSIGKVEVRGLAFAEAVFVILTCCAVVWMQTTFEEFIFRGFPLRLFCKNEIGVNAKSMVIAVVTSTLFMLAHVSNPEVTSVSGVGVVFAVAGYFVSGFGMFMVDILTGDLLPGIIIHFVNNMFCFILVAAPVSAGGGSSIFVDYSAASPIITLLQTIIAYMPVIIYLLIKRKQRSAQS